MIYLFDQNQNFLDEVSKEDILSAIEETNLNGKIKSDIILPFEKIKYLDSKVRFFGYKDESNFFIYKIINKKKEKKFIEYQGIHILFEDLQGRVIFDKRFKEKTVKEVSDTIFSNTDWNVFSTSDINVTINFRRISALEAFYKLLKTGCEYKVNISFYGGKLQKNIYFENHISKDYGKWFEYGDKLISVVSEENHSNVFTAFIGLGKGEEKTNEDGESTGGYGRKITFADIEWNIADGNPVYKPKNQEYVEIKEMTNYFGYPDGTPKITYVEFSEIDDKEKLLQATYEYALENSRPKLQLKAKAVETEKVEVGEIVAIIRDDINIRYKTRIFSLKRNLFNKKIQDFEFGDKIVISSADRIRAEKEEKEKSISAIESRLERKLKDITIDYFNEDGYTYKLDANNKYKLPAGIYSFDKPINENPTKVVYLGAGKVLISNEKGTDGAWKWQTAIDGKGIAGESIISNSITANKLASDVGQNLDLSSNVSINQTVSNIIENPLNNINAQLQEIQNSQTSLTQTGNDFTIAIERLNNLVNENKNLSDEDRKFIRSYFIFNQNGLVIGKNTSSLKVNITNDKMSFIDNGNEVAYFSNNKLYVYDGHFLNSLIIGNFGFFVEENQSVSFSKIGGING
ncbi:phage tail spike protein [Helcococcus bovis]|uniref:phage tail spike protein n=1 Tax=Helcococcus bovis TaxID=3153252 RepID=UPI0038B9AD3A